LAESGDDQILLNIKKGLRTDIARRFTEDCRKLGTKLQVAQFKLSHSRAFFLRAYLLQTHEMLFDAHDRVGGMRRHSAPRHLQYEDRRRQGPPRLACMLTFSSIGAFRLLRIYWMAKLPKRGFSLDSR
jgi:hypothetical protein